MKKRWVLSLLGTASMLLFFLFTRKNKRGTFSEFFPIKSAGKPDQTDRVDDTQINNAEMVSEGSIYGVKYYNEMAEEHNE